MCSFTSFCQDFNYSTSGSWIWLKPKEEIESFKKGKEQLEYFYFEKGYYESVVSNIHRAYLTKEQLALLQDNVLSIKTYIDYEGRIVTLSFMLPENLLKHIPEKILRKLYKAYCNVKFDMNKFKPSPETLNEKKYGILAYRLKP